jgi:hypothetical protein
VNNKKQNKETTMPIVEISAKDALRGVLLPTDWYVVRIDTMGDGTPSKDQGSLNYSVEGTILANADGNETYKGYPTPYWNFNSKALGFVVGFLRALGQEIQPGRVELKGAEGMTLKVFIEQGEYNGRMVNRIEHKYAPV